MHTRSLLNVLSVFLLVSSVSSSRDVDAQPSYSNCDAQFYAGLVNARYFETYSTTLETPTDICRMNVAQFDSAMVDMTQFALMTYHERSTLRASFVDWQKNACEADGASTALASTPTSFVRVLEGYQSCLARIEEEGLYCSLTRVGDGAFLLHAFYSRPGQETATVSNATVIGGAKIVWDSNDISPLAPGSILDSKGASQVLLMPSNEQSTVTIVTDRGSCTPNPTIGSELVAVELTYSGFLVGGEQVERNETVRYRAGDDTKCSEGKTVEVYEYCMFADRVSAVNGPFYHSVRRGTASFKPIEGRPNCVEFTYSYIDSGVDFLGACRGNGWVEASFEVVGMRDERIRIKPENQEHMLRIETSGRWARKFMPDMVFDPEKEIQYRFEMRILFGQEMIILSEVKKESGPFTAFFNELSGAIVLEYNPAKHNLH